MHCVVSRIRCWFLVGGILGIVCANLAVTQDPKQQPPASPSTVDNVPPDDSIMRAIRERAVIVPANPSLVSENRPAASRKTHDRWRIGERLLRQARIMERDAESLEQLGDVEIAESLRQLAASIRQQVVRMLQVADKPKEEGRANIP